MSSAQFDYDTLMTNLKQYEDIVVANRKELRGSEENLASQTDEAGEDLELI